MKGTARKEISQFFTYRGSEHWVKVYCGLLLFAFAVRVMFLSGKKRREIDGVSELLRLDKRMMIIDLGFIKMYGTGKFVLY